ncbi:MAG: 2-C-methyl-D-erythritol 2,4-cyclodiphosphate synthase [Brevinema sp.]
MRIALGYDLHRMITETDGIVVCGGVPISNNLKIDGAHSDGDVIYHALTDALLSVQGTDIGIVFSNTDPKNKNKNSKEFVIYAYNSLENYTISNIDIVVICDRPKISPYVSEIKQNISALLNLPLDKISVRGKTTENTKINTIEAYVNVLFIDK